MFNGGDVEARILKEWGIPFELVPGVTAACAASNIFAIPTTEIHKSNAIVHVIGYEINDDFAQFRDIARLFKHGATVALYMAYDNLEAIFDVFRQEGVEEDIPVAIAAMVSLANEDVALTTMNQVEATIRRREMLSPFVFFIGKYIDVYADKKLLKQLQS
jgi:siroheme synthase